MANCLSELHTTRMQSGVVFAALADAQLTWARRAEWKVKQRIGGKQVGWFRAGPRWLCVELMPVSKVGMVLRPGWAFSWVILSVIAIRLPSP